MQAMQGSKSPVPDEIAENIRFLACQGLSLRGDDTGDNSNFNQLLYLRALDDPNLLTWYKRRLRNTQVQRFRMSCLKLWPKLLPGTLLPL